jgi:hypothetical protein
MMHKPQNSPALRRLYTTASLTVGLLTAATTADAQSFSVNFSGNLLMHAAISTFNGPYFNTTLDSQPDILPFVSSAPNAVRFTGPNHPINAAVNGNILAGIYTRIDSGGMATAQVEHPGFDPVSIFNQNFDTANLATFSSGTNLLAAPKGTLNSAASLPNGTILPTGTEIYAAFSGFALDPNRPDNYWHDTTTRITHQVYTAGLTQFYYRDASSAFHLFASSDDSALHNANRYDLNTAVTTWSGQYDPVGGDTIHINIQNFTFGNLLIKSGVLNQEFGAAPLLGIYGDYGLNFTATFTAIPEPGSSALLIGSACLIVGLTRRRSPR